MSRFFIHLAYHGASYCGWQTQPGLPTVQQTLEQALTTLLRQPTAVVGCGRTDTGVHATDFYAHFDSDRLVDDAQSETARPEADGGVRTADLVFKLNNLLPPDMVVFRVFAVGDKAHARFDAVARTYQYHVSRLCLPFRQGMYCRIHYTPDLDAMNEAAQVLMQYSDFTSFAKVHTQVKTNICHLTEAHWEAVGDEWVFTIRSNRFLRNMVRSVTGTLLDVGRGKLDLAALRQIVERKDRCAAGVSMPACGLFLTRVEYPADVLTKTDER